MRRVLAALTLLAAVFAAPLLVPATAGALYPSWNITLNPMTADPSQALQVSGTCPGSGTNPGGVHLRVFNIVSADNAAQIDVTTAADGSFSGTFPANWTDTPGWYQVISNCPGISVAVGHAASPLFLVSFGVTPQTVPFSATPVDVNADHVVVSGSGCTNGSVRYRVFDGVLTEIYAQTVAPDAQGNWSDDAVLTYQDTPRDATRVIYAECSDDANNVSALYSSTNDVSPPVTDPTTPATTAPSTSAPTAPTTAPAAAAVAANPTYTG